MSSPTPEPRNVSRIAPPIQAPAEPAGLNLSIGDIYYTLFRHKWKIILCSLAGLGLAFAAYKFSPPPYQSEAKLFIRYVITEGKATGPGRDDTITKSPDQRGETIITSELEVLTSMDLAEDVVRTLGADKILSGPVKGDAANIAAAVVNGGMSVEVPPKSSVISVKFRHSDPTIVQSVLREIVGSYLKKHVSIHRAVGIVGDFLTQETDQLRARLAQTEEELRQMMNKAGVISLEDSKRTSSEQIARLRQQIFDLQTDLAGRSSVLKEMTKTAPTAATAPAPTAENPSPPPAETIEAYQKIAAQLAVLRQKEQVLRTNYTEQSSPIQELLAQQAEAEVQKKKLEAEFPALTNPSITMVALPNQPANAFDPVREAAQIVAIQSKIKILNSQLEEVRAEAAKVDQLEISILEIRRRKELEEANYRYYSANLEQSRINEALGTGRVSNISMIESPTRPVRDWKKKTKLLGGLAVGGLVLGLAWAFAIDMFLDRTLRRSVDIERALKLPIFLSIPKIKTRGDLVGGKSANLALPTSEKASASTELAIKTADSELALNPFYETLRDRLINYFETLNVQHKPKLVAVTGLGKDTGVTTIAAGLARSFSETGEGNVLLVDMTKGQGSAQHFHKGVTGVGLEQLLQTKDSAQVHTNLYVVSEDSNSDRLAKGMPQRFNQLIPKLKASDFDYIIFDMPPVSQISITPRLASFMDMMLMVVESEKTDRDAAAKACDMLAKSKSPVGIVLNKTKAYVPQILQKDDLNDL